MKKILLISALAAGLFPLVASANSLANYHFEPASGSTVESIKKISIFFPDCPDGIDKYGAEDKIVLQKDGVTVTNCAGVSYGIDGEDPTYITLNKGVAEPGTYTLVIPAETFCEYENSMDGENTNPLIEATYIIEAKENLMEAYETTPAADAKVSSFAGFSITFPKAESITVCGNSSSIIVTDEQGATMASCDEAVITGNKAELTLSPDAKADGKYTLVIPAGTFTDGTDQNAEIRLCFNVELPFNPMSAYSISPESGSTLRGITSVKLTFGYSQKIEIKGSAAEVSVKNADDLTVTSGGTCTVYNDNMGYIVLDQLVSEPGTYTVEIPAGFFADIESGSSSPAISATYKVVEATPVTNSMTTYTIEPTLNQTVSEIEDIVLCFPQPADGIECGIMGSNAPAYATLKCNDVIYRAISIKAGLDGDYKYGVIKFPKITEEGTYDLWIANDIFYDYEAAETDESAPYIGNPEIRGTYIVDQNAGVESVAVDAEPSFTVYDIMGRRVNAQINELPRGLYIINGKKVMR